MIEDAPMTLEEEAREAERLLAGKIVKRVWRPDEKQVVIEFSDGTRFFADARSPVDLSIT